MVAPWSVSTVATKNASPGHAESYKLARRYIFHAPVLERSSDGLVKVALLNLLPTGIDDLAEYLLFDFKAQAAVSSDQYGRI